MIRTLNRIDDIAEAPQDHAHTTYAPKIEKFEGEIRWSDPAATIYNKFRAFDPWPGVFRGDLKLIEIERVAGGGQRAGAILSIDSEGVTVATGVGAIRLITLQRAGKARQRAVDFARGAGWRVGEQLE